ncbi:MAG: hypothetical protein O9274_16135 [Limnobacter sp.]|uniref:hypothetical protein n=1 Tax=Limnobacter sp. TaxID=2003368 RepID=UPI0022C6A37C|nr:hypothetical protein [Limnobacter sp.]MCZ8017229.1 hypothetical protein [Limnobacter sp.]MCZ8081543.1 hypothetical protein [Paracoccaceae bacterium]
MAIPLRTEMIKDLIAHRFGSVDDLVVEWEERVRTGQQKIGSARNRGTVYRWLDEGLPARKDDILGFAALLDVDPIALLRIDDEFVRLHYGRERRLFQLGILGQSRLAAFWAIYMPGESWPNQSIARTMYGRDWTTSDYRHEPALVSNVFACFRFTPTAIADPISPWVVHFSYRRADSRDGMWRPYGSVIRVGRTVSLISESGDLQERTLGDAADSIAVETHFGPGAAEFRVASLHAFELKVVAPSQEGSCLRFGA